MPLSFCCPPSFIFYTSLFYFIKRKNNIYTVCQAGYLCGSKKLLWQIFVAGRCLLLRIIVFCFFTDTGHQHDRDRKSDRRCQAIYHALYDAVAFLYIDQCHTKYGTVCRDQRQINAKCIVQRWAALFRNISTNCTSAAMTRINTIV